MNPSTDDPDDLVRKKIDLNHITKMSYQMHVPDSITVGPNRSAMPRINHENDRLPIRMEVPDTIRLSNHANTGMSNGIDHSSDTTLPTIDDDDYTPIDTPNNQQPADSWHIEPLTELDDKHVLNKLQLLQNRIHHIERTLARRDFRDRFVYTCIIGYFLVQTLLSVRRTMLN